METQDVFLTNDGRENVLSQLELLRTAGRAQIAQYLHDAKESGDVIDNAAYEEAKNQEARLEGRILELEQLLAKAKLISRVRSDVVSFGSVVHLRDNNNREYHYTLVGAYEAKPSAGLISSESPVGRALLSHKVGDLVVVDTPGGVKEYTILDINGHEYSDVSTPKLDSEKVRRIEPNFVDDSSTHKYINTRNRIQRQETEAEIASTEQDSTVTIRIMENPLTAQNFATIISALTDLHTKCWLIQQGRLNDLIEYTQTHNPHFTKEANLIIVKLTHNSPAEIKLDVGVREVAEALKIGIDCIAQAPLRHEEAKIRNQADALDIKLKELDAQAVHADKEQARQIEAEKAKMIKEKNST